MDVDSYLEKDPTASSKWHIILFSAGFHGLLLYRISTLLWKNRLVFLARGLHLFLHMVSVGERSGTLEEMLMKAADAYEEDVETSVAGLTSILEPLMIVIMGVSVGFVVMAILFPMLEMSQIVR